MRSSSEQAVFDGCHALNAARNFCCLWNVGRIADETAQLNHALECLDIDFARLEHWLVQDDGLDLAGDDRVFDIGASAFRGRRRDATSECEQDGSQECGSDIFR